MYIKFEKLVAQNFMSIGNTPLELNLSGDNKTLIVGKNFSGKTTMFQALTFALFGRSYAKIKKANLVNSINAKSCRVELEFSIGDVAYKIVRCIKPDNFQIFQNGELIDQSTQTKDYQLYLEENIIKMTFNTYTQLIMLGTAGYTPFLQLSAIERRNFVESILDIELFTSMNKILKSDIQANKNIIFEAESLVNASKRSIATLTSVITSLSADNAQKISELTESVKATYAEYKSMDAKISELRDRISKCIVDDVKIRTIQENITKCRSITATKESDAARIRKNVAFFDKNPTCPQCSQVVGEEHKAQHLHEYNKELNQIGDILIKANKTHDALSADLVLAQKEQTEKRTMESQLRSLEEKQAWLKTELTKKYEQKKQLETQDSSSLIQTKTDELANEQETIRQFQSKLDGALSTQKYYDKMLLALKDSGAKAEIIKNYIPLICSMVNKHLEDLNLYVKFELDEEFNETLKSRQRDPFSFNSFSMGERARINLAMLFAWREIIKIRTGISTNLIMIDEILEVLDYDGFADLMGMISLRQDINCFIISHKTGLEILFDKILKVEKVKGFTQMDISE